MAKREIDSERVDETPVEAEPRRRRASPSGTGTEKISLEDVASRTRIPQRHLERLICRVGISSRAAYTIGFAKSYASAVGLDRTEIGDQLREEMGGQRFSSTHSEVIEAADPARTMPKWLVMGAVIAVIVLVILMTWVNSRSLQQPGAAPENSVAAAGPAAPAAPVAPQPAAAGQAVVIAANEPVWMQVSEKGGALLFGHAAGGTDVRGPDDGNRPCAQDRQARGAADHGRKPSRTARRTASQEGQQCEPSSRRPDEGTPSGRAGAGSLASSCAQAATQAPRYQEARGSSGGAARGHDAAGRNHQHGRVEIHPRARRNESQSRSISKGGEDQVRLSGPITALAAAAALALVPSSSASAQRQQPSPEQRIDRLERQVQEVQRRVFPKGRPADTAGFPDDPAATQSAVMSLDQRLDALERQMADMLRQTEENGSRLRNMEAALGQLVAMISSASRPSSSG